MKREQAASRSIAVTGVGGGVGQAVLGALRLSPLHWRIVGLDAKPWGAGLYSCDRSYLLPPASDASYVERLLQILTREQVPVLIPGSDPELSVLAEERKQLLSKNVFPLVGAAEAVRLCRDKLATSRFFIKQGFPFARTVPICEALRFADEVGYPLVIKPVGGSASSGIAVVFTAEQLQPFLHQDELIAQEYLVPMNWNKRRSELERRDAVPDGVLRQEDEISVQVLFDHEGQWLGTFSSRNILKSGVPIFIDPWPRAPVEEIAFEMAASLVKEGLTGPCNLQCKLTERGPLFFEVNPRFTGITAVRAAMGFNEVEAVLRRLVLHEPLDEVRQQLQVPDDLVCSRYTTDVMISRAKLDDAQREGFVERSSDDFNDGQWE